MGWLEPRPVFTRFMSGVAVWLLLALMPPVQGQNVAQPPSAGETLAGADALREPVIIDSESLPPAVTVEHHGRLLVLTYGSKPSGGVLSSNASPRGEPPRFTISQGQRQITSGQFEYG